MPKSGLLFFFLCLIFCSTSAHAQANPTAIRDIDITVFGGITHTYTGLSGGGGNNGVTGGVDLNLPAIHTIRPSLEVRATSPYDSGKVDGQKDILGGLRVETAFPTASTPTSTSSAVAANSPSSAGTSPSTAPPFTASRPRPSLSPGAGFRFDLNNHFMTFGDVQLQHWNTPASLSGHLLAKPFTAGLVYRFTLTRHHVEGAR